MTPTQKLEAKKMLHDIRSYYERKSPPQLIIDRFFPFEQEVDEEFHTLYTHLKMLSELTSPTYWRDFKQDNPAHQVIASLKTFSKLDARTEHRLLILGNDYDRRTK
jgi:hypothetical protein